MGIAQYGKDMTVGKIPVGLAGAIRKARYEEHIFRKQTLVAVEPFWQVWFDNKRLWLALL